MSEIGDYELEESIGEGSFALVRLATHKTTHVKVAVKIIPRHNFADPDHQTRFQREVDLIKGLDHPFIAEFFEVLEDSDNFYVIMEYVEKGNMLDYVNDNGELAEEQARHYFYQLIAVLEYLHTEKRIAHRDLKCENVLLDRNMNIRLIDFGLSNMFSQENPYLKTACGSPAYASPEMVKGQQYTIASDLWSAGILLYAMVMGELPFEDDNMQRLLQKIIYTDPKFSASISPQLTDLLKRMLTKDPEKRITLNKIKEHPWFSQYEYSKLMNGGLSAKWCILAKDEYIDREILKSMTEFGYDCQNLVADLLCDKMSPMTAVYRMLKKCKITDLMKELSYGYAKVHEPARMNGTQRFRPVPPPLPIKEMNEGTMTPNKANPRNQMYVDREPQSARTPSEEVGVVSLSARPQYQGRKKSSSPVPPQCLLDSTTTARRTVKPVAGAPLLQARKRSNSLSGKTGMRRPLSMGAF